MTKVRYGTHKKYHFIYKTTNILSGKYYIGMHSTDNLDDGYLGSGKYLKRSINKHGKENHKIEILEYLDSREELAKREAEIVNLQEIAKKECMNLKVGGIGGWTSEMQKENAKKSNQRQAWLRINDPIWNQKIADNKSKALKESYLSGSRTKETFYNWLGKTHSTASIQKMKDHHALTGRQKGENNSNFGMVWIHSIAELKSIKIKKTVLDEYLTNGYELGRVTNFDKKLYPEKYIKLPDTFEYNGVVINKRKINSIQRIFNIDVKFNGIEMLHQILFELYNVQNLSTTDIGKQFNVDHVTIIAYLKLCNIERRQYNKHPKIKNND